MLLSIIIVNYKTSNLVKDCINSLETLLSGKRNDVEIIVVDNGSGEDEVKKLQKLRDEKDIKLLISSLNIGFGAGCNFGTTIAKGDVYLFLNSDTRAEFGVLEMADTLKKEKAGILGGRLVDKNGNIEKSAGKFFSIWNLFLMLFMGGDRIIRFAPEKYQKVDFVSGGFMTIGKKLFEKLEGFDEDYFMYIEDMDLCLRAKKLGFDTYYYPDSKVIHKEHGSSNRGFAIVNIFTSLLTFYKKNQSNVEYSIAKFLLLLKAELALNFGKIFNRPYLVETYAETLKLFR